MKELKKEELAKLGNVLRRKRENITNQLEQVIFGAEFILNMKVFEIKNWQ